MATTCWGDTTAAVSAYFDAAKFRKIHYSLKGLSVINAVLAAL